MALAHARPRVIAEEYFIYQLDFPAGMPINPRLQILFLQLEADADFLLQKFAYQADIVPFGFETLGSQDMPLVNVLIIDTASGRQMSNVPVPITAYMGDGRLPYILPTPKLYPARARLRIETENFGVQAFSFFRIEFQGKKIFTAG